MKIALYYPWVYLTSGAERSILELVSRSRHQWTIFTNRFQPETTFPGFANCHVVQLETVSVTRSPIPVAKAGWRLLTQRLPMQDYDALVVVCEGLGDFVVRHNHDKPIICICLTPLRIAFDPQYRARYFANQGWFKRLVVTAGSQAFRWIDRWMWRRYDHVFCISDEVKRRVLRGRLAPEPKLEVAYVGLGFEPPSPSGHFGDYFLLPGRIMWTKNIELGIQAFQRFLSMSPEFEKFRLVVAGIVDEKSKSYLQKLKELTHGDPRIEFRIFPSDVELHELYDHCYGVLFTAFNEDWGIVPIEGMAFGKPAIATNSGGPRESIQHGVQGFLEAPQPKAFARRMAELVADPERARNMGQAGRLRAKLFTWERFTGRVDSQLELLCTDRGRRYEQDADQSDHGLLQKSVMMSAVQ